MMGLLDADRHTAALVRAVQRQRVLEEQRDRRDLR